MMLPLLTVEASSIAQNDGPAFAVVRGFGRGCLHITALRNLCKGRRNSQSSVKGSNINTIEQQTNFVFGNKPAII